MILIPTCLTSTFVAAPSAQVVFTVPFESDVLTPKYRGQDAGASAAGCLPDLLTPRELYMKARLIFYCAALVALVLILAAVPSHATERRDPLIMPDAQQTQGAKSSGSAHGTATGSKAAKIPHRKSSHSGVNPLSQAKDKSALKNATSASSVQNDAGTSAAAKW